VRKSTRTTPAVAAATSNEIASAPASAVTSKKRGPYKDSKLAKAGAKKSRHGSGYRVNILYPIDGSYRKKCWTKTCNSEAEAKRQYNDFVRRYKMDSEYVWTNKSGDVKKNRQALPLFRI
jgi:hypothetical protein